VGSYSYFVLVLVLETFALTNSSRASLSGETPLPLSSRLSDAASGLDYDYDYERAALRVFAALRAEADLAAGDRRRAAVRACLAKAFFETDPLLSRFKARVVAFDRVDDVFFPRALEPFAKSRFA
jgi:hypothetical protein